jgi:hypothetical protein
LSSAAQASPGTLEAIRKANSNPSVNDNRQHRYYRQQQQEEENGGEGDADDVDNDEATTGVASLIQG